MCAACDAYPAQRVATRFFIRSASSLHLTSLRARQPSRPRSINPIPLRASSNTLKGPEAIPLPNHPLNTYRPPNKSLSRCPQNRTRRENAHQRASPFVASVEAMMRRTRTVMQSLWSAVRIVGEAVSSK